MTPDESNDFFDHHLAEARVLAILRGYSSERTVVLGNTAWAAGIDLVEVPVQGEAGFASLRALAAASDGDRIAGAGTVTSLDHVHRARELGAQFTVAPGWNREVFEASLAEDMPHLPGVATGTEIQVALGYGLRWLKGFPATALGLEWFRGMRGPFPEAHLVATGGLDSSNAQGYLDAGASAVALGASFARMDAQEIYALRRRGA